MNKYIAIALLLISVPSLRNSNSITHGTAVFAMRTPKEIVFAADSRVVNENNFVVGQIRKIRNFSEGYAVVNGINTHASGLNVMGALNAACKIKTTFDKKIAHFENSIITPLENALNSLLTNDPKSFKAIAIDMAPLGVNFAVVENNIPILYNRRFVYDLNTHKIHIERHQCPGDCDGYANILVGPEWVNKQFIAQHPNLRNENIAEAGRKYIQMQIDGGIEDVGPPILILQITPPNNSNWY